MLVSVVVSTQTAVLTFDRGGGHNIDKIAVENNPYFQEGVDVVRAAPFGYPVQSNALFSCQSHRYFYIAGQRSTYNQ